MKLIGAEWYWMARAGMVALRYGLRMTLEGLKMDENLDALSRVFAAAYSSAKAEGKSDEWSRISAARACSDFILGADNGWVEVEGPKRAAKKKPNSKN